MIPARLASAIAGAALATVLAACGGGGGGDTPAPATPVAVPASGTYGWLLKAEGSTAALKYGLSLIHPALPAVEWVVEPASEAVTDAQVVAQGTRGGSGRTVTGLVPQTLVYIVGGDVRRVPLAANGSAPRGQVQRAQSTSACRFSLSAVDALTPENSRFIVSTAGADGLCGSSDDGAAEVKLAASAPTVTLTPLTSTPLAVLRDPDALVPRGWVLPTEVRLWNGGTIALRDAADALQTVLAANDHVLLAQSASGWSVLGFDSGNTVTDTPVTLPDGAAWQSVGHDGQYFYLSGSTGRPDQRDGTWFVVRVAMQAPVAEALASGSGYVPFVGLGRNRVYVTVWDGAASRLLSLAKAVPGAAPVSMLGDLPSTSQVLVLASAADVHSFWRQDNVGSGTPVLSVSLIDETGAVQYATSGGGWQFSLDGATTIDFDRSENRTRFIVADGYGSRAFGDARLVSYDAASRTRVDLGTLPGSGDFGSDTVFAGVNGAAGSFMTGFAARSAAGVVQPSGARLFSFDAAAGGLSYTTQQQ